MGRREVDAWPHLVLYPDGTKGEVHNTAPKEWEVTERREVLGSRGRASWRGVVLEARQGGRWRVVVVGGCCRTMSEDIARLREAVCKNEG